MPKYLEIQVSLKGSRPHRWRRLLLPETATFEDLHRAIEDSFGWHNDHMFEFYEPVKGGAAIAGVSSAKFSSGAPSAKKVLLTSFLGKKRQDTCHYVYDFGAWHLHIVTLRQIVELPEKFKRRLIGGRTARRDEDGKPQEFDLEVFKKRLDR